MVTATAQLAAALDDEAGMLEPDVLLPAQFFTPRGATMQPERRLMRSVLEDAILCFREHLFSTDVRGARLFQEAEAWLKSEDVSSLFSFVNVCGVLGLDPGYVRDGLRRWRQQRIRERHVRRTHAVHASARGVGDVAPDSQAVLAATA